MRAAAVFAGSIIAIGIYLVIAAAFAFTPTWIGLGVLAISIVAAGSLVYAEASRDRRLST